MKLYNLYKEVILESTKIKDIQDVISNNLGVNITYVDNSIDSNSGPRYCQVLAIGRTSKGNDAIRVYQISGPNLKRDKKGKIQRWKTLRVDRIQSLQPTNFTFYAPPDELYNALGDKTLNISSDGAMANMAIFKDKNLDSYRERHANWQSNIKTKKANEPNVRTRTDNQENPQSNSNQVTPSYQDYEYTKYDSPKVDDEDIENKETEEIQN